MSTQQENHDFGAVDDGIDWADLLGDWGRETSAWDEWAVRHNEPDVFSAYNRLPPSRTPQRERSLPPSPPQHFVESLRHQQLRLHETVNTSRSSSIGPTVASPASHTASTQASPRHLHSLHSSTRQQGTQVGSTSSRPGTLRPESSREDIAAYIDELLTVDEDMDARNRLRPPNNTTVDLTAPSSSSAAASAQPHQAGRDDQRRMSSGNRQTSPLARSRKRRRDELLAGDVSADASMELAAIEQLDLTQDNNNTADASLVQALATQQAAASSAESGPQRLGKRACIICLESFTDATATSCGHIYCHKCLMQALSASAKASERGIGTCPMCRKLVSARSKKSKAVFAISFMKKSEFPVRGRQPDDP